MQMVKRNIRRPLKRNIEQIGQQDAEPPPARRQRLPTVPTEAAAAAGTEDTTPVNADGPPPASPRQETPPVDSVPTQFCSGCNRTLPLCEFPTKDGKILRTCVRCRVRQQSRLPPTPPQIGHENVAPPPVRRARQSRAWANANRAAAQRRRTASVEAAAVSQEARTAARASQKARKAPLTAAADYDHHGVPVFYRRGERADDTPAMQQARRDKVAISRAHRVQARDDLQPSPSQTPPLPDIMRGRQELDALHRRHEEERMAGASPSPTPAIREHMGQRRDRTVSPSPSSPFSRL
ncbi:hypothetical protein E4U28_006225, partial [Claviceps purpurea]